MPAIRTFRYLVAALALAATAAQADEPALTKVEVFPPEIHLATARDRQSVVVDAYIDTKDEKAPRLLAGYKKDNKDVPGEVTSNTDYLILADNLETVRHAKYTNEAYKKAFDNHVKKLKEQAAANGVPVIALKKYLDMIGYRPSRVVATTPNR